MAFNSKHFFLIYLQYSADLGWFQLGLPMHCGSAGLIVCGGGSTPRFLFSPGTTWGTWACPFHGDSKGKRASKNILYNSPLMKPSHMTEPRDRVGGHNRVTWQGAWYRRGRIGASGGSILCHIFWLTFVTFLW